MTTVTETPLMVQYRDIKARYPQTILFFRMGDFYEMFYEDAETAARVLGLTLTARNNGGAQNISLGNADNDFNAFTVVAGNHVRGCCESQSVKG